MEDLLSSILEVVSEIVGEFLFEIVFPNLSLYPLLPKKSVPKKQGFCSNALAMSPLLSPFSPSFPRSFA